MKEAFDFQVNGLDIHAEFDAQDTQNIFLPLLKDLTALQKQLGRRIVAFLAAPPAAGKSTLCCYLEYLSRTTSSLTPVQSVGIDGFHHTNEYLRSHFIQRNGEEIPLSRVKGGPESYDVEKLKRLLATVNEPEQKWPMYSRRIHDPVENAVEIYESILLLEGNWLLLDEAPWNELKCDYSIFLAAGDKSQLERVVQRKIMGGFSEQEARIFVMGNDWPNIQRCMKNSRRGDLNLAPDPSGVLRKI